MMADSTDFILQLGAALRQARIDAGYTQEELATALQLTPATIARYELGSRRVSVNTLLQIAEVIGQPLSHFLPYANGRKAGDDSERATAAHLVIQLMHQRPDLAPKVLHIITTSLEDDFV